jgi:putative ABC transport system permease protein
MRTLVQDLRYGMRMLVKHPGFTLIAVLTLSLGIGANTAMFSLVHAVFLRSLPFPQPERIVMLFETAPSAGVDRQGFSPANYSDIKARQQVFSQMSALFRSEMTLTGAGEPERLEGFTLMDGDAFDILGVTPARGRRFLPEEFRPGSARAVLISHRLWQQRFGGASDVIGKALVLNDEPNVVVGVLPADLRFLNADASFWAPAAVTPTLLAYRDMRGLQVVARLKPDVTREQAQAETTARMQQIARDVPSEADDLGALVQPLHDYLTGDVRRPLLVLVAGVAFVLLIGCANLANLLLSRAVSRRKEIAVRVALGVGRWRIARQLITESVLLSVMGGACGLFVAAWSLAVLRQFIPQALTSSASVGLDGPVLAYTLGLSVLTGVLFGLVPAWQATRLDVHEALKQGGARAGSSHRRLQNVFVVAEVAMALVLLIGAGLLIQTFYHLRQIDPGFRAERMLTLRTPLPRLRYGDHARRTVFFQQALERVRLIPGVTAATYVSQLPLAGRGGVYAVDIEGRAAQSPIGASLGATPSGSPLDAGHRQIGPDYFRTLGIAITQGRDFNDRDTLLTQPVAIINETMARRYWPNESPLLKRFGINDETPTGARVPPLTIVGVAADVAQSGLETGIRPEFYLPHAQVTYNSTSIPSYWMIRTAGDPVGVAAAARGAMHAVDPNLLVADVRTMDARLDQLVAQRRLRTTLLTAYAGLALLLAAIGIYGVLADFVTQHASEIGIRMALGAQTGDVMHLVLRRGMSLALAGVTLGLIAAWTVTRLMKTLLFGVDVADPTTFSVIALMLLCVALAACWIPARRAARVDPLVALRHD